MNHSLFFQAKKPMLSTILENHNQKETKNKTNNQYLTASQYYISKVVINFLMSNAIPLSTSTFLRDYKPSRVMERDHCHQGLKYDCFI